MSKECSIDEGVGSNLCDGDLTNDFDLYGEETAAGDELRKIFTDFDDTLAVEELLIHLIGDSSNASRTFMSFKE